jgi:uncharacterized protein (TIGR03435 family)
VKPATYALFFTGALLQAQSFEAVSIKPSHADDRGHDVDGDGSLTRMRNVTLKNCIRMAYGVPEPRILGVPKLMEELRFDIDAKAAHPAEGPEYMAMIQSMLADRFQLSIHHESRTLSGYALTVTKSGIKAKPSESDGSSSHGGRGRLDAKGNSMERLAIRLADLLGVTVVDATELQGKFDFSLKWTPDEMQANAPASDTSMGPSIFTALQEQLGLRLEARKVPTEVLVIDHAKPPSEN